MHVDVGLPILFNRMHPVQQPFLILNISWNNRPRLTYFSRSNFARLNFNSAIFDAFSELQKNESEKQKTMLCFLNYQDIKVNKEKKQITQNNSYIKSKVIFPIK